VRTYSVQQNQKTVPNQQGTRGKTEIKPGQERFNNGATPVKTPEKAKVPNNVLVSPNGSVYRKKGTDYQTFDGKEWKPAEPKARQTTPAVQQQNVIRQQPQNTNPPQTQKVNPPQQQTVIRQQPQNFNRQEMDKQVINRDRGAVRQVNQNTYQQHTGNAVQKPANNGSNGRKK